MTTPSTPNNPEEISGVLSRINQLGAATERVFSRLYIGISWRAQSERRRMRRSELQEKIETARRVAEQNQQLRESLRRRGEELDRLHGILATIHEGIIMQDNEGRIAFINRAARELLGTQKNFWETELGKLFEEHHDVTQLSSEIEPLGEPTRVQVNNRILGAQLAAVANEDGERLGTMIVLRDVTRDALTDRLKDQFVTAISHELKTPMTVIKGMSEVLMGQPADKPVNRRFLETLSRNVDVLDRMVVELLDVSEMGAGAFEIRRNPLHIEPLLWSVVNGVAPEIRKNRLDVIVMARDVPQLRMLGDDQRLRWAMGHLIQNSVYYTEPGGHIIVAAGLDEQDPQFISINFIDDGVGIADKDMPHIFERFYRGDPRNAEGKLIDPRGLGQGLFVAKRVAETHGGYLNVQSEVGRGSIFTLALPAAN